MGLLDEKADLFFFAYRGSKRRGLEYDSSTDV